MIQEQHQNPKLAGMVIKKPSRSIGKALTNFSYFIGSTPNLVEKAAK